MVLTCDKLRANIREKGMTVWAKLKLQFLWTGNKHTLAAPVAFLTLHSLLRPLGQIWG